MDKKKTEKKAVEFRGKIIPSAYDFQTVASDVTGSHHVLYPISQEDVATAVTLSQNHRTFVRSGIQVVKQDMVDGTGGIVINLRELANVTIKSDEVQVEAAATTEVVAKHLAKHGLALPLADNPLKSIASNVLHEGPSCLMRSLGLLSNYVSNICAVEPNSSPIVFQSHDGASCVDECRASNALITQIKFKAAFAKDLWMFRITCPYPGQDLFLEIAKVLFAKTDISKLPARNDLVLDAYNGAYYIPFIRIVALGASIDDQVKLENIINSAIACVRNNFNSEDIVEEKFFGASVLSAIADTGLGAALDPTIASERLHSVFNVDDDLVSFLTRYASNIHHGIAFRDKGEKINESVHLSSRLQLNRDNGLEITGYAYTRNSTNEYSSASHSRSRLLHIATNSGVPPPPPFTLPFTRTTPQNLIPSFNGAVYMSGESGYNSRAKQYATLSFPRERMTPFIVAYPNDEEDIKIAIEFARERKKCIVARSGGHQYSGKSSGGDDTIVLSMDNFQELSPSDGNTVKVGPAVRLTSLADYFKGQGITIPHGECPKVAIGGHVQTGGYGHLVRSFGLALDFVESFDIVLANTMGKSKHCTITRPKPDVFPVTDEEKLNQEIFWGVLGGNAGSFGIVTNYKFKYIKDADHSNSYVFSARRRYNETAFKNLMKQAQRWTQRIENGTLPLGIDFMMTVASAGPGMAAVVADILPFPFLLVELVHSNLDNEVVNRDQEFRSIIDAAYLEAGPWERKFIGGEQKNLSVLSNSFVRRWETTLDGREFKYAYKKRVNCTKHALTNEFVERFVVMINDVVNNEPNVKLIFQMLFGGGAYATNGEDGTTSIPHRDYIYCFVFDLFYKEGYEERASDLQQNMQELVNRHFSNGQELRVFWGSFGDTNISKQNIRNMYYDNNNDYIRLQKLKKKVDPDDIFHTELTVQLPPMQLPPIPVSP